MTADVLATNRTVRFPWVGCGCSWGACGREARECGQGGGNARGPEYNSLSRRRTPPRRKSGNIGATTAAQTVTIIATDVDSNTAASDKAYLLRSHRDNAGY